MSAASGKCQVCDEKPKTFNKIKVQDMVWHKKCCECVICKLQLTSKTVRQSQGKAYCVKHCPKPSTKLISLNKGERDTVEERSLPYFHGEDRREDIERRLIRNGDFLVRWSTNASAYVVSVKHSGGVSHASIPRSGSGFLFYEEVIPTLRAWIDSHMRSSMPISGTVLLLTNPVKRSADVRPKEPPPPVELRNSQPATQPKYLRMTRYDGAIQISQESICKVKADGIVNSIGLNMVLSTGALGGAIAAAGGPEIQRELNEHRRRSAKVPSFGDVIVTRGFNLPCKHIFHTTLKSWEDVRNVVQELSNILKKIFRMADEMKLKSIALPPIGSGALGYPKQVVAQVLYSEAAEYLDTHPDSSIDSIIFAVYGESELYETFVKLQEQEDKEGAQDYITMTNHESDEFYEKLDFEFTKMASIYTTLKNVGEQIFPYPDNWTTTKSSQKPYDRFELDPNSDEYKGVVANMIVSGGKMHTKLIAKIERIENGHLYQLYEHSKKLMIEANSKDVKNERVLWHGTTAEAVDNIVMCGFNRTYAGAHATCYGHGVYFAVDFSYSTQSIYSQPDNSGLKRIFQCRVLTGKFCLGHKDLREPEFLRDGSRKCDSAVDSIDNPSMFVIFKDFAAYPEHLISFYDDLSSSCYVSPYSVTEN